MIRTPILRAALLSLALNWSGMASAREAAPMAADIEIEKRMVAISDRRYRLRAKAAVTLPGSVTT